MILVIGSTLSRLLAVTLGESQTMGACVSRMVTRRDDIAGEIRVMKNKENREIPLHVIYVSVRLRPN